MCLRRLSIGKRAGRPSIVKAKGKRQKVKKILRQGQDICEKTFVPVKAKGAVMSEQRRGQDICDRTFVFAVRVVKLCRFLNKQPDIDRTLIKQLVRSGTSIGANVEEAQA